MPVQGRGTLSYPGFKGELSTPCSNTVVTEQMSSAWQTRWFWYGLVNSTWQPFPTLLFGAYSRKSFATPRVPVLLPAYLPAWPDGYYIEVGDDDRNAWPIYFASRLDIGPEDDTGDVGFFDDQRITPYTERERKGYSPGVPVRLTEGRMGYYLLNTTPHHRHDASPSARQRGDLLDSEGYSVHDRVADALTQDADPDRELGSAGQGRTRLAERGSHR